MRVPTRLGAAAAALALTLGGAASAAHATIYAPTSVTAPRPAPQLTHHHAAHPTSRPADCAIAKPGKPRCLARIRTDIKPSMVAPTDGIGPSDLQTDYNLPSSTNGSGQTVAIVDQGDDPNIESDLAEYRSHYSLPECSTANGCFKKVDEHGGTNLPPVDSAWTVEIALDVDAVSAVCPKCNILLVEGDGNDQNGLPTAVNTAVKMGAKYVSNSYVSGESADDAKNGKQYYDHPGVAVVAGSGDSGYQVNFPAAYPSVVAVGGTTLSGPGSETAWNGTGSGCSQYEDKPSWQTDATSCSKRANNDVAADADPSSGLSIYNTGGGGGGWQTVGGTSLATPIIAGIYALAGPPGANDQPVTYPYKHASSLNDVTSGSNGSCDQQVLCNAGTGWDGPTGLGTPNGIDAFKP
jgi:hypothetical protein